MHCIAEAINVYKQIQWHRMSTMNGWVQLRDGFNVDGSPHLIFELSDACRINSTTQLLAIRIACYSNQMHDGYGYGLIFELLDACRINSTTQLLAIRIACYSNQMYNIYGYGFNVDNGWFQPHIMDSTMMTLVVAMLTCNSCDNDVMFDVCLHVCRCESLAQCVCVACCVSLAYCVV